ncbi:MAG: hypothetical protein KAS73_11695, partial [Candidatus Sabulitectum sp.]|nr:hypothetical protein [Candidatus Sabulitectum sp.]
MGSLFLAIALTGSVLTLNWSGDDVPQILETPMGDRILMIGAPSTGNPGAPLFPIVPLTVALPEGAVADSIKIVSIETIPLSYDFMPMPAQIGVPISRPEDFRFTSADPEAFSKQVSTSVRLTGQGTLMGYSVADILLNPASWDPDTRNLNWTEAAELQLYYHFEAQSSRVPSRGIVGGAIASEIVQTAVINPHDMPVSVISSTTELPWGEYLIIADDALASAFEPLAEWKTQKGIPAEIVEMSY